jgi:hypothetical protein
LCLSAPPWPADRWLQHQARPRLLWQGRQRGRGPQDRLGRIMLLQYFSSMILFYRSLISVVCDEQIMAVFAFMSWLF